MNIPYNRKLLKKYILIVFYQARSVDIYTILVYNALEMRFSSTWTYKIDKNSTVQVFEDNFLAKTVADVTENIS